MCFEPGAPIADECRTVEKGHGRLTERTCRTSQVLHPKSRALRGGYSQFPGLRQVAEVTSHVKELRRSKVVKETITVSYAATNLSPGQANAKVIDRLLRRHWMIENRHHYVRDNRWREDRATWRTGDSAFAMFVLLAVALFPVANGHTALARLDPDDTTIHRRGAYPHSSPRHAASWATLNSPWRRGKLHVKFLDIRGVGSLPD